LKITAKGWQQISHYLAILSGFEQQKLDMTGLLQQLLNQGTIINTVPIRDQWFEVDSASDLECYEALDNAAFPKICEPPMGGRDLAKTQSLKRKH
jgi:hypothetical protein